MLPQISHFEILLLSTTLSFAFILASFSIQHIHNQYMSLESLLPGCAVLPLRGSARSAES